MASSSRIGVESPVDVGFTARTRVALLVLSAAVALDIGSVAIVNPALPEIGRSLDVGPALLQWTLTAYGVGFAGFLLLGGRLADVAGSRFVLLIGLSAFGAGAIVAFVAPNAQLLIGGRALQGVGAALSVPSALALVLQVFPPGPTRHRALAVYTGVGAAGFGVGLVGGGLLTAAFGWRWIFAVVAAAAALTLVGVRTALPRSAKSSGRLDVAAAVAGTAAVAMLIVALSEASSGGRAIVAVVSAALSAAFGVLFGWLERRHRNPLLPVRVLKSASARNAAVGGALFFFALNGVLFVVPLYLQGLLGYTPLQSGLAVLPMALVVAVTSHATGRLMTRVPPVALLVLGLVVLAVGVLFWARTSLASQFGGDVLPPVLVMAFGQGIAYPALTAASVQDVDDDDHGVAGAVNVTAQQIGASVGVAAVAAVSSIIAGGSTEGTDLLRAYHIVYVVVTCVLLLGSLSVIVSIARRRCRT